MIFKNRYIFKKIRDSLGGQIRLVSLGSAPINDTILDFLRCVLGAHINPGYGMTECAAACTVTLVGDYSSK